MKTQPGNPVGSGAAAIEARKMKLQQFVIAEAVIPELKSVDRDGVINELIDVLLSAGAAPSTVKGDLVKMIVDREKKGSTGFGKGVAVPHAKHQKIKKMAAAIGVSQKGLDFNALDKAPVHTVFLLLSPQDKPEDHLHAMEVIFSNLQKDTFRRFLKQAKSAKDVIELLQEADSQQLQS